METFKSCNCTGSSGSLGDQSCWDEHFLYFAYGSNLLRERIMLRNPSVAFFALANLLDYTLAFGSHQGKPSTHWHGSTATIVPSPGDEVWGIVWNLNINDMHSLDIQEGVEDGVYVPIDVNVHTQEGKLLKCRSYQMNDYVCNLPSPQYKKVICMGAKQNGLPSDYQKKLDSIETNNYTGAVPIFEEVEAALKASEKNKILF
ncbi:gamma-glutamylcyclotransferase [Hemicordylus capensis]|uniref:gamma-glutamylcyclotransferase n=1 Tax=Hemicordylus capensis TaxID=884348 RepID=UPI002302A2E2|nr:gamma-glutamylcyclotransferase [Hemicordylus capensis]XP_053117972.1 gamma-glutamylcyclotransferase [Hemicordylus capensis]XP_053117973.1 gamma-glutamylcyclotransferase [Hemicordylus capensis]XP_053117974.1 gamma-glutamylcyclotransferase [Hemicordylus capensis]